MFTNRYTYIQKYAIYKACGLEIACQALIELMNNTQRALVLQMESNSKTR